jgi:hypothetical protein
MVLNCRGVPPWAPEIEQKGAPTEGRPYKIRAPPGKSLGAFTLSNNERSGRSAIQS